MLKYRKKIALNLASIILLLLICLIVGISSIMGASKSFAASNNTTDVSVKVSATCSISGKNTEHTGSLTPGTSGKIGDDSTFEIICNDPEGYVVYAVGSGKGPDGSFKEGVTDLVGTKTGQKIATGISTGEDTSNWNFRLSNPIGLTINTGFDQDSLIPNKRKPVAYRAAGTAEPSVDSFTASYSANVSTTQKADSYSGRVNYVLFHPGYIDADGNAKSMQDWSGCGELNEHEVVSLQDSRDGSVYRVSKLKDGQCWMVDNLALGGENEITLTPEDSDVTRSWTLPAATDGWDLVFDFPYVHIGEENGIRNGYYPYIAATAGTGTTSTPKGDAKESICPKGWRLPSYAGDFSTMVYFYGGWDDPTAWAAAITTSPVPGFTLMGKYNHDGTDAEVGEAGYWWSSTTDGPGAGEGANANAWAMDVSTTRVSPGDAYNHPVGYSVRCIKR